MNASDFKVAGKAPEYFGQPMACIMEDAVSAAFELGKASFSMMLSNAELRDPATARKPDPTLDASLQLSVPSCAKPVVAEGFVLGTVKEPSLYSLHACDCFGEAHASAAPVTQESNQAVTRNSTRDFNVGPVEDQKIFSGPFACEQNARTPALARTCYMLLCDVACAVFAKCTTQSCRKSDGSRTRVPVPVFDFLLL